MGDKQVYTPHKSKLLTNPTYYHESAVKLQKIPLNLPEPRRSERLNPTTPKETNSIYMKFFKIKILFYSTNFTSQLPIQSYRVIYTSSLIT